MLKLALAFELRALARSRAALVALVAFLAVGALAIVVGQRFVAQWKEAVVSAESSGASVVDETRGYLARGESGPADRPWVDLSQPLWQDWYSGIRVARIPSALAGIAAGAVDPAPAVFKVHRLADPLAAGGYRIQNPELAAGAVDMVLVLGLLLPLLVGVLGLNVGSRERETRLDQLVTVQAGSASRWMVARMVAIALIAGAAAAALCLVAGTVGGADASDIGLLIFVALLYTALWSGLLLSINAQARTVRSAAFSFGTLWMLLCVLLPTLGSEFAVSRLQADYAVAETLDARGLRYGAYKKELETVLPELYASYPSLEGLPAAADDPLDDDVARHAYDGIMFAALETLHRSKLGQQQAASRITGQWSWLTPSVALALALERLAGVGPEAAAAYQHYLVDAVMARGRWVLEQAWSKRALGADDYESLLASAPEDFEAASSRLLAPILAIGAWALAAWLVALARIRRASAQGYERVAG